MGATVVCAVVRHKFAWRLALLAVILASSLMDIYGNGGEARAAESDGVALLQPTAQVQGSRRVALVIGNGAYTHVTALKNTVQDASAISTKLRDLGYQIQYAQNVDRKEMNEAITAFLARVEPGMEAAVYYAGHGVELNGANFLLPTDIPALDPEKERLLRTEGVNVNDLLLDISDRHAMVTLVILDACRDNPFRVAGTYGTYRSLGATRGLANPAPPRGSFVIFSAGAGEKALDNLGSTDASPNGLFTRKLLALMDKDGLELRELVRELRVEVSEAAASTLDRHSQVPGYYDQMIGEFYFRPKNAALPRPIPEPAPVLQPPTPEQRQTFEPRRSQPAMPAPDAPKRVANLPVEPPHARLPIGCPPGQESLGGICKAVACADGMRRNKAGQCHDVPSHTAKKTPKSRTVEKPRRFVQQLKIGTDRKARTGACVKSMGVTYC